MSNNLLQPPPQVLRFMHGRGERETPVTGDEPQGTMGRVQTPVVSFPPSFTRKFASRERRLGTRLTLLDLHNSSDDTKALFNNC